MLPFLGALKNLRYLILSDAGNISYFHPYSASSVLPTYKSFKKIKKIRYVGEGEFSVQVKFQDQNWLHLEYMKMTSSEKIYCCYRISTCKWQILILCDLQMTSTYQKPWETYVICKYLFYITTISMGTWQSSWRDYLAVHGVSWDRCNCMIWTWLGNSQFGWELWVSDQS